MLKKDIKQVPRNMFRFWNTHFFSGSMEETARTIFRWIDRGEKNYVCVTGLHGLTLAQKDKQLSDSLNNAGLNVTDGMPLVWIGKLLGFTKTSRIYGPDLLLALCEISEKKRYRLFFYGTTEDTLENLKYNLLQFFPKLKIVGVCTPPFRELIEIEKKQIRKIINKTKTHVVCVGLSSPKQEKWMAENIKYLNANVLIGVGAAFDFISGHVKQAPRWMQNIGLEWLFRLIQEPGRLTPRYLKSGTLFIFYLLKYSLTDFSVKDKSL